MSQDRDECDDMAVRVTCGVCDRDCDVMCARRRTQAARADFYIRDTALRASQLVLYAYS